MMVVRRGEKEYFVEDFYDGIVAGPFETATEANQEKMVREGRATANSCFSIFLGAGIVAFVAACAGGGLLLGGVP